MEHCALNIVITLSERSAVLILTKLVLESHKSWYSLKNRKTLEKNSNSLRASKLNKGTEKHDQEVNPTGFIRYFLECGQ